MIRQPLVSILIPAYNAEQFIAQTLRSALDQTWPRKEIIVVDDGSKDGTLAVARQFASDTVTVVSQPNSGASVARNKAFSVSRGDFIQWLDADDLLAPDKITTQMAAITRDNNARHLHSGAWGSFFYRFDKTEFIPTPLWENLSPVEWLFRKLDQNLFMQTATWLVSRELTEAAGPWDNRISYDDDGEYFARVVRASSGIRFVPDSRVLYRLSGAGTLSYIGRNNKKLESLLLSMQRHIETLRSMEDSPRVHAACVKYLQRNLIYYYPQRLDLVEKLNALAATVGGKLETPALSWKYNWLRPILGWDFAKRAQDALPRFKGSLFRSWDRLLYSFQKPRPQNI
ncbi:MAG TPA: glycosyltransferase family 2 protein [Verrucomicrobiota bacterium]|nr:glycosyltransferase family 2 protein [Verrucomicrobiota bacterium]